MAGQVCRIGVLRLYETWTTPLGCKCLKTQFYGHQFHLGTLDVVRPEGQHGCVWCSDGATPIKKEEDTSQMVVLWRVNVYVQERIQYLYRFRIESLITFELRLVTGCIMGMVRLYRIGRL
jgi:wyosine [tRNA(Phe)-imidazoG37] synthetase (radical SAM superfamily)